MKNWARMSKYQKEKNRISISDIERNTFIGEERVREDIIQMDFTLPQGFDLHDYQAVCRIYLDEYEVEEVDLRVNFDTSLLMKRFMVKE